MAGPEQPPRPKPTPEKTPEPTAMERALNNAGLAKPEVGQASAEEAAPAPVRREAKMKRGFRPVAVTENARQSYVQIGEELRGQGVEPRDLPEEVFTSANAKIDAIYRLAEEYGKETNGAKKRAIAKRMLQAKDALEGRVVEGIERKVGKLLDEQELRKLSVQTFQETSAAPLSNPWEKYGNQGEAMRQAIEGLYPGGQVVPADVIARYDSLIDRQQASFGSGDATEQETVAKDIADFIAEQVVTVDASEFAAPQFAENGMQADIDALNEISPAAEKLEAEEQAAIDAQIAAAHAVEAPATFEDESLPSVFHHNRREPVPKREAVVGTTQMPPEEVLPSEKPEQNIGKVSSEFREDGLEYVTFTPLPEGTPKELKQKLRELVGKFVSGAKEKVAGVGEHLKTYLTNRSGELDAEAAKMGMTEKGFRWLGEQYDRLGGKAKLAIGLTLGIGMGVGAAVSLPLALTCLSGATAQRAFGLSSAFLKYENSTQDGKWKKEKAMTKAVGQAALMTGGILLLAEGAKEATEWLKQYLSSAHAEAPVAEVPPPPAAVTEAPFAEVKAEVPEPAAAAAAEAVPMPHPAPETLVDQEVLEQLVEDERMTEATKHALESQESPIAPEVVAEPSAPLMDDAMGAQEGVNPLQNEPTIEIPEAEVIPTIDAHDTIASLSTEAVPTEQIAPTHEAGLLVDSDNQPVLNAEGTPIHTGSFEEVSAPAAEQVTSVVNSFGVEVPSAEPHLYADSADNVIAYGGTSAEQAKFITEYLTAHPDAVVQGVDTDGHRVPFTFLEGKVVAGPPLRTSGFLGIFSGFAIAPAPEEFAKIVK